MTPPFQATSFKTPSLPDSACQAPNPWRFCIAPMMDWSDRHCRFFWRLLTKQARLYTEMLTTGAILHGDRAYLLDYNPQEHPLALQLGGSNAKELAECCRIAEDWGYQEVNLNCGCPSDRVQNNKIGACLMAEPTLVAECVHAMRQSCSLPITVKHRLGIDDLDSWDWLVHFVDTVRTAGCDTFIVHARKAWLQGLSPKQNREVPPLDYRRVLELKNHFPSLNIVINGGIKDLNESLRLLQPLDGVMMGREAYNNPYILAEVDQTLFDSQTAPISRAEVIEQLIPYCEAQIERGVRLSHVTRHILGVYNGLPGARAFRRCLSEKAPQKGATIGVLKEAISLINAYQSTSTIRYEQEPSIKTDV